MMPATEQHYVLPAVIPTAVVYLLAIAAIAAWVAAHRLTRHPTTRLGQIFGFAVRVAVGFAAILAVSQALQRGLVLATNWPLWPLALLGATAIEVILALYAMERQTVSRRLGLALAALRVTLVALVIVMLAQPVWPWVLEKTIQRFVAVLVDNSASMYVPDTQLGASEKMRLAEKFAIAGARRPYALDLVAEDMDKTRADLAAQGDWLASISSATVDQRQKQLQGRRDGLQRSFEAAQRKVVEELAALAKPLESKAPDALKLTPDAIVRLDDVRKRLGSQVGDRLREALTLTSRENAKNMEREHGRLVQTVRQAVTDLADITGKVASIGQTIDEIAYAALPADAKGRVDATASKKRIAVARDVLMGRPVVNAEKGERGESLLAQLSDRYSVKLYSFASAPTEEDAKRWAEAYGADGNPDADAAALPPAQQQTDLAAAIEKVMGEMADKQLSGILVLSDGRHNAAKPVDPLVKRLGANQVPVSSIVFGSERPPLDAGILSVEAPESLATRDRMLLKAHLKLDGLGGRDVKVSLVDGDKIVDSRTERVPNDRYRASIELGDEPATPGLHHYRVEVQKFEGEVLTANNQYPITVNVTDERIKLLIIDGRPRWEFRYLKNLFAGRDRTVRLQHVLLESDRIEGVPLPPKIAASAGRPIDDVEANLPPKDEAEWMKFDVIILGDVAPKYLGPAEQLILQKFVADRGGTLIIVSGPLYMPHVYGGTPLAEVLPVVFKKDDKPIMTGPEKSFRIALTAEGRESVIMRQQVAAEASQEIWDAVPDIYWRHPILHAKEGATVLAYAMPPSPPDFLPKKVAAGAAPAEAAGDAVMRERRDFERQNALIAYHSAAMGQVMFLGFDHTWRLRYRTGDTYHHRFWGQVLRWATANKLPAGTETVRVGTDRSRYSPEMSVRVRARLAKKDYTPITSDDVAVNVFVGEQLVMHRKLQYLANSPGMYAGEVGELPAGNYRLELDAPAAKSILASENASKVATEFSVEPSASAEQAELAPDRGMLARLAGLTGGGVSDPTHADRILGSLGKPTEVQREPREYILWDSWPLMIVMILVATVEWLLRKKVGLA
jgi:hypothetical protein